MDPWRYQKYRAISNSDEARGNLVMGPQFHRRPFRSIRSIQCSFIADASYWLCLLNIFSFQPLDRLSVISAISDWLAETNLFFDSILRFNSHELFPVRISIPLFHASGGTTFVCFPPIRVWLLFIVRRKEPVRWIWYGRDEDRSRSGLFFRDILESALL